MINFDQKRAKKGKNEGFLVKNTHFDVYIHVKRDF